MLLDANPLANIRNVMKIRAVVANGRYFGRAALDTLDTNVARLAQVFAQDEAELAEIEAALRTQPPQLSSPLLPRRSNEEEEE